MTRLGVAPDSVRDAPLSTEARDSNPPMRLAIFFTPPEGDPLTRAAARWLGRDAFSGQRLDREPVDGFPADEIGDLTADPRRYGFHATLKPPFRVAAGHNADEIVRSVTAFCAAACPLRISALRIERLGSFFALTPGGPAEPVMALAADVVRAFDVFRAPSSPEEIERRRPDRLPPRQRENLKNWGYPYVFDDFRFHMTLTGSVPRDRRDAMEEVLHRRFAAFVGKPLTIDALAVLAERDPPADFVVETRVPLGAAAQPMDAA